MVDSFFIYCNFNVINTAEFLVLLLRVKACAGGVRKKRGNKKNGGYLKFQWKKESG